MGSDQLAASEFPVGALGAGTFTNIAIAAGVASLPDPITEIDDDVWFLFQGLASGFEFGDATGFSSPAGVGFEIDSKAMRKLPDGRSIGFIAANLGAAAFRLSLVIRLYVTAARA